MTSIVLLLLIGWSRAHLMIVSLILVLRIWMVFLSLSLWLLSLYYIDLWLLSLDRETSWLLRVEMLDLIMCDAILDAGFNVLQVGRSLCRCYIP